ncbi:MAG: hypothetical protein ACTSYD_01980 [Candidatus Heimdallarchaeaceae archaeon]
MRIKTGNKRKRSLKSILNASAFWYVLAFLLRLLIAAIFYDKGDCPAFIETAQNVLLFHYPLYYEPTTFNDFVYPPLAYAVILPGMGLYYLFGLDNVILRRVFLKLPIMLADLWLAFMFKKSLISLNRTKQGIKSERFYALSWAEVLLLFNPFLIYSSAVKAQFFNVSVICMVYAWRTYQNEKDLISGFWAAAAILIKQYSVIFAVFLGWVLLKQSFKRTVNFVIGAVLITIPTLAIGAVSNLNGMIDKTILFNISKEPAGYSITAMLYSWLKFFSETSSNLSFFYTLARIVTYLGTALLLIGFIYLAIKLWQKELSDIFVLKSIIIAFTLTFLLNKQFWFHYLPVLVALWLEYKHLKKETLEDAFVSWNYALIPILLVFRITNMIPRDVIGFLGTYWALVLIIICFVIHFVILGIMYFLKYTIFPNRRVKILYAVGILGLGLGMTIQLFMDAIFKLLGLT